MGCGRTGSWLAEMLDDAGHEVSVVDWSERASMRRGRTASRIYAADVDHDVLCQAGTESADAFVAGTSGDNRNIMAGQIAREVFNVPRVVARIKDPNRAAFFKQRGLVSTAEPLRGRRSCSI